MALAKSPSGIVASGDYPLLEISPRWERVKLGEIASVQNGAPFSSEYFTHGEGMPLIRIRDVLSDATENFYSGPYDKEFAVRNGDILIGMDGDFHAAIWKGADGLLNQRVCRLTLTTKLYSREFFFLTLQPYLNAINAETSSVTVKHLSSRTVADIPIPLPPIAEQKRIVAKIEELFSELEAGEESLGKARRQLGVYRQSLLKQAFEGKLTEKWRNQNPSKLKSAATSRIPPEELKNFPALPSGWHYARFGDFIHHIDAGKSFRCEERRPSADEIGVAKVSAVTWGEYDEAESKTCIDPEKVTPAYFIHPGDFILSRANTIELVGTAVIVRHVSQRVMLSDKTLRLIIDDARKPFLLQFLRSRQGRREIEKSSTGNQESMRNIGQDRIRSIVVPECPLPEQQEIVRLLDAQFEAIERSEREIDAALQRSEALRQAILKKAFTGRLVAQDPSDEPASELLARLQAERNRPSSKTSMSSDTNTSGDTSVAKRRIARQRSRPRAG